MSHTIGCFCFRTIAELLTFNHLVFVCVCVCLSLFHRRIDVSPRAFKKHSQLFEAMKSSEDGTYKVTEHFAV